jgi:nicotinamidase-related amidase
MLALLQLEMLALLQVRKAGFAASQKCWLPYESTKEKRYNMNAAPSDVLAPADKATPADVLAPADKAAPAGNTAIIVVDMLNDFVTGSLACERGVAIVPALARLIAKARKHGIPVIYSNDAHLPEIDHELKLWGEHAMAGSEGAMVVSELAPQAGDFIVPKRRYSGFFQTDMNILLQELGVSSVIMTGLHTHMCVRHTAANAYMWGYQIVVASDATDAFTEQDYLSGIEYLKATYGARVATVDELLDEFAEIAAG